MSLAFLLWLVFSPVELFCTNHLVVFYYFATKKNEGMLQRDSWREFLDTRMRPLSLMTLLVIQGKICCFISNINHNQHLQEDRILCLLSSIHANNVVLMCYAHLELHFIIPMNCITGKWDTIERELPIYVFKTDFFF
jgi:hypothetical protein